MVLNLVLRRELLGRPTYCAIKTLLRIDVEYPPLRWERENNTANLE